MKRRKMAVLRANALGDFIFVLPALQALRETFPQDEIVYLGKRMHRELLANRPGPVDRVIVVPPYPGVGEQEDYLPDTEQLEAFFAAMQQEQFDIAIQLHGGGGYSNPFLRRLGARLNVGLQAPGAPELDINIPYITYFSETLRYLEVVASLQARTDDIRPRLQVTDNDIRQAQQAFPGAADGPFAVIHPSASDTRRHWPAPRFAQVADFLAGQGYRVCINGVYAENAIAENIIDMMQYKSMAYNLCGQLELAGLVGLVSMADLVVSNDSGPLHLAHTLQTPAVGIYWVGNMITGTPLACHYSRPLISWITHCPLCGTPAHLLNGSQSGCSHHTSFVTGVETEEVIAAVLDLMGQRRRKPVLITETAYMGSAAKKE